MRSRLPNSNERGQAGVEVLVGIVLLFGFVLVLMNVWAVLDAKTAVTSAARLGAQTFIEQDNQADARTQMEFAVHDTLDDRFGADNTDATADLGTFGRCFPVTVTVTVKIPLISVPFLGAAGGTKTITGTHRTRIDPFRNNVPGEVNCA